MKISLLRPFCQTFFKFLRFSTENCILRFGILCLPLHRTRGDASTFTNKNGEVHPYPRNKGSLFGLLAISCLEKAANQRRKGFLSDYRLYLRKCSWGRKKKQNPQGSGMTLKKEPRKCNNSWTKICSSSVYLNPKRKPRNSGESRVAAYVLVSDSSIRPRKGTFTDQGSRTPSFLLHQELLLTRKKCTVRWKQDWTSNSD